MHPAATGVALAQDLSLTLAIASPIGWGGLAIGVLGIVCIVAGVPKDRARFHDCPACAYDLRRTPLNDPCPECGDADIPARRTPRTKANRPRIRLGIIGLVIAGALLGADWILVSSSSLPSLPTWALRGRLMLVPKADVCRELVARHKAGRLSDDTVRSLAMSALEHPGAPTDVRRIFVARALTERLLDDEALVLVGKMVSRVEVRPPARARAGSVASIGVWQYRDAVAIGPGFVAPSSDWNRSLALGVRVKRVSIAGVDADVVPPGAGRFSGYTVLSPSANRQHTGGGIGRMVPMPLAAPQGLALPGRVTIIAEVEVALFDAELDRGDDLNDAIIARWDDTADATVELMPADAVWISPVQTDDLNADVARFIGLGPARTSEAIPPRAPIFRGVEAYCDDQHSLDVGLALDAILDPAGVSQQMGSILLSPGHSGGWGHFQNPGSPLGADPGQTVTIAFVPSRQLAEDHLDCEEYFGGCLLFEDVPIVEDRYPTERPERLIRPRILTEREYNEWLTERRRATTVPGLEPLVPTPP